MKRVHRPYFSSGPCAKPINWSLLLLSNALIGRSQRAPDSTKRIKLFLEKMKSVLKIPDEYQVGIIAGSATGAVESLLWALLGYYPVDVLSFDVFGELWAYDIIRELKIPHQVFRAKIGEFPIYKQENPETDVVWVWNGSSAGVSTPHVDFLHPNRTGLAITDITSAAFAMPIPWLKIDAAAWSWQKGLGGEAGFGMIALSPKAIDRLNTYKPSWPIPRCFRIHDPEVRHRLFNGIPINTISLLALEDSLVCLDYLKNIDFFEKSRRNASYVQRFVDERSFLSCVAKEPQSRSVSTFMFTFSDDSKATWETISLVSNFLEKNNAGLDVKGHSEGLPAFRIWCGPTVEEEDLKFLLSWMDRAFKEIIR